MDSNLKYPTVPQCRPYHPNSELKKRPGYYPNISAAQLSAVNELSALLSREGLDINTDAEEEFLKLLRFLRARKFDVAKSFDLLKKDVMWRNEENRLNMMNETASETLDCDVSKIIKYFPAWIQGVDKQDRPVSYRQFGKFEIWSILKFTTMSRLLRFHAWETEQALRVMYEKGKELECNLETFVVVIDAAGWSMKLATGDAFTFIKGMATTDSDHYPERLGMLVVINAPTMLSAAWRIIKGFLDEVTTSKIKIFSSEKDWQPVLFEAIDRDQIPKMYGGYAENPDLVATMSAMAAEKDETPVDENSVEATVALLSEVLLDNANKSNDERTEVDSDQIEQALTK